MVEGEKSYEEKAEKGSEVRQAFMMLKQMLRERPR